MGLQTIINHCETLNIDRRRVMGVQYTRSEIAKISETPTRNPWRLNLEISAGLQYSTNRALLESIDYLDRKHTEDVSFGVAGGASPGLSFIFAYQGGVNQSQLNGITVASFSGNQLTLNLPNTITGAGTVLFQSGDLLQIQGSPYPFSVLGPATASGSSPTLGPVTYGQAQVVGGQTQVTLTTHRPNFITATVAGQGINVGNACIFRVFCPNMPTYKLNRGGPDAYITWTSGFQLYEYLGDA